jgi:hypothetical protein
LPVSFVGYITRKHIRRKKMDRIESFAQSYSQAPWRKQMQIIGLFSLVLVLIALVAGVYLNVSARATAVGRDIQDMQREITDSNLKIENQQSQLAMRRSAASMRSRAESMGFITVQTDQIVYLSVPGYVDRQSVVLAPPLDRAVVGAPYIPAEYTESLFDWARRNAYSIYQVLWFGPAARLGALR